MSFCGECGTENPDMNSFCKNCGRPLRRPAAAAQAAVTPPRPADTAVQQTPVAASGPPQGAPIPAEAIPATGEKPKRTWLGFVGLIPAIASWILYPYLLGVVAVAFGVVSIALARKNGTRFPVAGVIAIIIGILSIIVNMFWLVIFPPSHILPPIE